jgi:chromosome partitioning protein
MLDAVARERAAESMDARCRVLLISSPKGGSGKSVLSRHLLVSAAQSGVRAIGLDFDRQQTLTKWAARRAHTREAFPDFAGTVVEPVTLQDWRGALRRTESYQLAVLDTPPSVEDHLEAGIRSWRSPDGTGGG